MNSKLWIRKALTTCLMVAMVATYSMVALANGKAVGELIVTGNDSGSDASAVIVNGEASKSGRTIFSSSTISTSETAGAIVNLGKVGRIEIAPKTTFALTFDDNGISGDLAAGSVTVLNSTHSVSVKTPNGSLVSLNAGETASTQASKPGDDDYKDSTGKCIDADKDGKEECDNGAAWWWFALIFGGAGAGLVIAANANDDTQLGGGTTVVSPTR